MSKFIVFLVSIIRVITTYPAKLTNFFARLVNFSIATSLFALISEGLKEDHFVPQSNQETSFFKLLQKLTHCFFFVSG